jgi:hypothetical protein
MLKWMYAKFGLVGNVAIFALAFFFFILWLAGVAGLNERATERKEPLPFYKLVFFLLIPPLPILWIIKDMWYQRKMMKAD